MNKFRLSFAIIAFSSFAWHVASADVSDCLGIDASLERLACYDNEAGYPPIANETLPGKGDWIVKAEISKMDDSKNVWLSLESYDYTSCPYKNGEHSIHIACRENKTNIWLYFGGCFMSSIQGKGKITYRLDSEDAKRKNFRESNNNMALGLWSGGEAITFIKQMLDRDRLIVRATPFSDSTVTAEYNISGLKDAIAPLREACKW